MHGFPESSHEWRGVANELADEWRVIAPDTRGHGQSEVTEEGYTRAHFAQDIVDLMDALEIERCPVIAHDWGGIIAVKLALDHGERVERLCLLDTLCTGFPAWANYYYWFMDGDRAEKFFAEHGADFIRSVIGGQVTQLPDPPGCPAEWTSPEMTAPVAWASEEDLETYYKPYTEGEGGWVSCQYYRNLKFNRVIEDAAAPFGERYEPVSMEEMGETAECHMSILTSHRRTGPNSTWDRRCVRSANHWLKPQGYPYRMTARLREILGSMLSCGISPIYARQSSTMAATSSLRLIRSGRQA